VGCRVTLFRETSAAPCRGSPPCRATPRSIKRSEALPWKSAQWRSVAACSASLVLPTLTSSCPFERPTSTWQSSPIDAGVTSSCCSPPLRMKTTCLRRRSSISTRELRVSKPAFAFAPASGCIGCAVALVRRPWLRAIAVAASRGRGGASFVSASAHRQLTATNRHPISISRLNAETCRLTFAGVCRETGRRCRCPHGR
jgi:hypothetical protein